MASTATKSDLVGWSGLLEFLDCSENHARKLIKQGILPCIYLGDKSVRFYLPDVLEALKQYQRREPSIHPVPAKPDTQSGPDVQSENTIQSRSEPRLEILE